MAPLDSTTVYLGSFGFRSLYWGFGDNLSCAVHLPDGATVTGFAADVVDLTVSYQTSCALRRVLSNSTFGTLASTPGSGVAEIPGLVTLVDATIDTPVIDNATYAYTATCLVYGAASSDLAVVKVTVTYSGAP
jgi:hypothetical protein